MICQEQPQHFICPHNQANNYECSQLTSPHYLPSVTPEFTMYCCDVTLNDITYALCHLISSQLLHNNYDHNRTQQRTVFRWESDDFVIWTHNFQHYKNNAMFQRDLGQLVVKHHKYPI